MRQISGSYVYTTDPGRKVSNWDCLIGDVTIAEPDGSIRLVSEVLGSILYRLGS